MTKPSIEYALRERCRELCARHPDLPRLQTIAAVGAYDAEIGGTEKDSWRLTAILDYLLDSGYLIDPGFEIDVVNFREGRDFLKEDKKADLVFIAYILDCRPFNKWETFKGEKVEDDPVILSTMLSFFNHAGGWSRRLVSAEAKIVAAYGGNLEIGTNFLRHAFEVLIPSPDEECASNSTVSMHRIRSLYPALKDIDAPIGWLGFAGDPQYLKQVAPSLNTQTCLGRRGLNPKKLDEPEPVEFDVSKRDALVLSGRTYEKTPKKEQQGPGYRQLKSNRAYRFR